MPPEGVEIRPPEESDLPALRAFFARIPEGEQRFFKDDASVEGTLEGWFADRRARRLVAVDSGGAVLGYAGVLPDVGWSSHVAELALVIDPEHRRRGLGRELARLALREALELGVVKIVVEVVAEQISAVAMFESLGFEAEALLRKHVRDRTGRLRDLIVLAHPVEENWSILRVTGIEDAVT